MNKKYRGAVILLMSGFLVIVYLLSFYNVIRAVMRDMPEIILYYVIVLLPLVLATVIFLVYTMWIGWRVLSSRTPSTESMEG